MEALIAWFGEIHWVAVLQIILIDILLGGDNAVVIALACRSLDPHLRVKGIIYGAGGAILLRVILIAFAVSVMNIPFLKFCGGLLLFLAVVTPIVQWDITGTLPMKGSMRFMRVSGFGARLRPLSLPT